jgi:hypothetical protein
MLTALALTAHMRNKPVCYKYAYAGQGYSFDSDFILLCVSFGRDAVTAALPAKCPMYCCCRDIDAMYHYDDGKFNSRAARGGDDGVSGGK